ncbi:putative adenylyl cyclase CyaB [Sphaerotilus mobilis]|uniref:Putative adenylyl cyclase CyaB n=1 Tax=Sphaerotilus mobilis TaxID=47994 RepID=A0A4Q7LKN0_9BURK|nr:putative adenylyl cyclase CyaB [Sphaerotilus mobilis]
MPSNIEIKARLPSLAAVEPLVAAVANEGPVVLLQDDTFFACANGRLKLRAFGPDAQGRTAPAELIFYQRADAAGPKASHYRISACPDPDGMRALLAEAQGQTGRVRKRRVLYIVGRTRVHLDAVEGLGDFLELEVVMRDGEQAEVGLAEARALMAQLGIGADQLVARAYVDLLADVRAWHLDLADSELAEIRLDADGGLQLRLAVAVLVPSAAQRAEGVEAEHALGASLRFEAVDGIDAATLAEVTPGRIRSARVVGVDTGRTLALPCPGTLTGSLRLELAPAHGPALAVRAAGVTVSLPDAAPRLGVHAC